MKYQKLKNLEFKNEMIVCNYLPMIAGTLFFGCASWVFMPPYISSANYVNYIIAFATGITIFLLIMFAAFPVLIQKRISTLCAALIEHEINPEKLSPDERIKLIEELFSLPRRVFLDIFLLNLIGNILFLIALSFALPQGNATKLFLLFPCFTAPLLSGLFGWDAALKICTKSAKTVTENQLDFDTIIREKHFGSGLFHGLFVHTLIPLCILGTFTFLSFLMKMINSRIEIIPCLIVHFVLLGETFLLSVHFKMQTFGQYDDVNRVLEDMVAGTVDNPKVDFDLNYDISLTFFLINKMIRDTVAEAKKAENAANEILLYSDQIGNAIEAIRDSIRFEGENISSSTAGMDKIAEYQRLLDTQFSEMSLTTKNTQNNIHSGSSILVESVGKIEEITQSNIETISGIKELSEQIEKIWSVISTIDSITEKTKTIAFNAEIETSGMGDSGENFHIVANEIRRLADSITDSTLAIRKKITSIQHASDNLVITSEGGTEKIREESELFTNLEEKFEELKLSGSVTEESAELIRQYMETQKTAFSDLSFQMQDLNGAYYNLKGSLEEVLSAKLVIQEAITEIVGGEHE